MTAFEILIFFHLVFLIVSFGSVIVIDTFGLFWLLKWFGVGLSLVKKVAETTQKLIWLGYAGMLSTGIPLLVIKGEIDNLTWVKLFLVAMVGVNGIFLHTIKKAMEKVEGDEVSRDIMAKTFLASTISQVGWWGALLIGYYHHEIDSRVNWPLSPLSAMLFIVCGIALLWAGLSLWSGSKKQSEE